MANDLVRVPASKRSMGMRERIGGEGRRGGCLVSLHSSNVGLDLETKEEENFDYSQDSNEEKGGGRLIEAEGKS